MCGIAGVVDLVCTRFDVRSVYEALDQGQVTRRWIPRHVATNVPPNGFYRLQLTGQRFLPVTALEAFVESGSTEEVWLRQALALHADPEFNREWMVLSARRLSAPVAAA